MVANTQMTFQPNEPITLHQAAAWLKVDYQSVWRWANSGRLKVRRVGTRDLRTTIADLERFMGGEEGAASATIQTPPNGPIHPEHAEAVKNLERMGFFKQGVHQGWPGKSKSKRTA